MPATPLTVDKGLRRGVYSVLLLECVSLVSRLQPAVVNFIALASKECARLEAERASMFWRDHSVESCLLSRFGHLSEHFTFSFKLTLGNGMNITRLSRGATLQCEVPVRQFYPDAQT